MGSSSKTRVITEGRCTSWLQRQKETKQANKNETKQFKGLSGATQAYVHVHTLPSPAPTMASPEKSMAK